VAAIRGVEIAPDELAAFVQMFRQKQKGSIVPDLEITGDKKPVIPDTALTDPNNQNDEEETI
jgi:hypothetical protein